MDKTQKIKADLEAYRVSKLTTKSSGDIKADLEAYRNSKKPQVETRDSRISQGLPVGSGDNIKPTFVGEVVRGIIKPFAKLGASVKAVGEAVQGKEATGLTSNYLGNVRPIGEGFDPLGSETMFSKENVKGLKDAVGTGLDIASNIPVAKGLGIAKTAIQQPFKESVTQVAKNVAREGMVQGALSGSGTALQENKGVGGVIGDTILGTALGGAGGFVLGGAGAKASRFLPIAEAAFANRRCSASDIAPVPFKYLIFSRESNPFNWLYLFRAS